MDWAPDTAQNNGHIRLNREQFHRRRVERNEVIPRDSHMYGLAEGTRNRGSR